MYISYKIQNTMNTTVLKMLNKKESPSKDAWIILGREDKLVIGRRGEVRG